MSDIKVNIESLDEFNKRFIDTFEKAATGEKVEAQAVLSFPDLETFLKVMTPARVRVIRAIRQKYPQGTSIREVSRHMERNYKSVHTDIQALLEVGLLAKSNDHVIAPYDAIETHYSLVS